MPWVGVTMEDQGAATRPRDDEGVVRYASIRDYLRVIRRHVLLVIGVTLLVGGAAFALSLTQEKTYEATTALSFRDPLADIGLIGSEAIPEDAPQTRAAINAELITSPRVVARARRELRSPLDRGTLANAVSATVSVETNLVVVTARSADPDLSARIANAFAVAAKQVGTQQIAKRLENAEDVLRQEVKGARRNLGKGVTPFQLTSLVDQLSRVQTLKGIAQPVQITRQASPPSAPVSPRPARNTVLGLVAGLILGLIAAFLRDIFDRRFRTAHEVHQELGYPVLSRVANTAMGQPGLVVSPNGDAAAGKSRRNGRNGAMAEADFEAFRVLRTNLAYLSDGAAARTILVTSGLPEEGKSTVSMALASAAALSGQRVLLVECDFRRPTFSRRLGIPASPGLADYLRGEASPSEVVSGVVLTAPAGTNGATPASEGDAGAGRMACIPCGSHAADAVELLDSDRFRDFLATVSRAYELIVIDSSPLLAVVDPLRVAPHVDAVLICVRVMRSTREEARAVRSALANLPERPTGAVVTGLSRGGPDAYDYYYGY